MYKLPFYGIDFIFLINTDVEHLFRCLLTILITYVAMSVLKKCLFKSFAHF